MYTKDDEKKMKIAHAFYNLTKEKIKVSVWNIGTDHNVIINVVIVAQKITVNMGYFVN